VNLISALAKIAELDKTGLKSREIVLYSYYRFYTAVTTMLKFGRFCVCDNVQAMMAMQHFAVSMRIL